MSFRYSVRPAWRFDLRKSLSFRSSLIIIEDEGAGILGTLLIGGAICGAIGIGGLLTRGILGGLGALIRCNEGLDINPC